jgi:tetratricopeptide (TPR) repeat protein
MHNNRLIFILSVLCLTIIPQLVGGQTVSEDARRHLDRGQAAIEMAKMPADFEDAIIEFQKAVEFAPNWPDPYYNLGMLQNKLERIDDAIRSLKRFLELAPQDKAADSVRQLINRLFYKKEKEEVAKKVIVMMGSGLYGKKMVECSQTGGDKGIFNGPFGSYNSLNDFRNVNGKMEVQNVAFDYDRKYGGLYHPELRPPIRREWEPVKISGNVYEYDYIYYCDVASGHVAEYINEIKGEIVSINPPRAREVIKTASKRGVRIPGEKGRFIGGEGVAECIFEWILK